VEIQMDEWLSVVRGLKDDSEIPYKTEEITIKIYHDMKRLRIRDKGKFRQRVGPEFESWSLSLGDEFSEAAVKEILSDDEFWQATLKITIGI
jgi:hypothetical protein